MLNPRIFAFLIIVGFLGFVMFGGSIIFPKQTKTNTTNSTNSSIVYIEKIITKTVVVTPTPDGHTYFASEYQNGTRLLKRPFSFIRYGVEGKKDMKVTTIVYDYKFFDKLHWYNPSLSKYVEQYPNSTENKFCFVFIYVYMDDVIGNDVRLWMFNRNYFGLFDGSIMHQNVEYPYQLRYREIENTPTFDNSGYVQAFKQMRVYSSNLDYAKDAGEYSQEKNYLYGGTSNNIDGYLLFEIPKNLTEENLMVYGNFDNFGSSQWRLKY
jgi:hypothetical protein